VRFLAGLLIAAVFIVSPAAAQLAATVAVQSDFRLRGLSMNGGGPVLSGILSYDHPSGLFAEASATGGDTRRFGGQFLGHSARVGYSGRLTPSLAVDLGAAHTRLIWRVDRAFSGSYPEVFVGLSTEAASVRVSYSPSYLKAGDAALYVEANGGFRLAGPVRISGHAGWLTPLSSPRGNFLPAPRHDVSFSVVAALRQVDLQISAIHSGADAAYLQPRGQSANALVVGAALHF
jgi:uncharacterized protein (TIGR02001 family)